MPAPECIIDRDLRAYLLGELPEHLSRSVANHLEGCVDCDRRALLFDEQGDAVVAALRHLPGSTRATASDTGTSAMTSSLRVLKGHRIGGYRVLEEIGRGGMGVVYKAQQERPERVVALKVMLAGWHSDAERRARFGAEGDAIARLQHPNIVQVYEAGEYDGLPFLVLEFCAGGSLAQRLGGVPQAPKSAAQLVQRLAGAVAHAHQAAVVHRDLKPANVLLTADGQPKVSDFGLARAEQSELTATGAVVGTPSYMAPEQASGTREVGPPADVYALGAILYEMLTGRPPFRGATVLETLEQVRTQEPVSPRSLQPRVPRDLETVCLRCLEKEPARRYACAAALGDDLERFLAGRPVHARPVRAVGRTWRWARRNPIWAGTLAFMAGLLLAVAIGASWMTVQLNAAVRESEQRLWEGYLAQAQARRLSGRQGQRFASLAAIRKALALPVPPGHSLDELRNEAIACLVLADTEPATDRPPLPVPEGEFALALDPNFERYATVDRDGHICIRKTADGTQIRLLSHSGSARNARLEFSPDGRFLLHCHEKDSRFKLWRLDGSAPAVVTTEHRAGYSDAPAAFSPDSRQLVLGHGDAVCLYDTASGHEIRRYALGTRPKRLAFSPTRPELAVASGDRAAVVDLATGATLATLPHKGVIEAIDWHPRQRVLATTSGRVIYIWDVNQQTLRLPPLDAHQADGVWMKFNHEGDRLMSQDWDGYSNLWDAHAGRPLLGTAGAFGHWRFSSDDRYITGTMVHPATRLQRMALGRELRRLALPHGASDRYIAWARPSPDGRLLFCKVFGRRGLVVIDAVEGSEIGAMPIAGINTFAFEPNGALLTYGATIPVQRWPIRTDRQTGMVHIGPPQTIFAKGVEKASASADGQVLALPAYDHVQLLHRPDKVKVLKPCNDAWYSAISRDGSWVAIGTHHMGLATKGAVVWNAHTGEPVAELPVGGVCHVGFSPDGRWLITTGGGYRLWHTGSWDEGPRIVQQPAENGAFAHFAFTRDSKQLALAAGVGQVRLVNPNTGAEIARLSVPELTIVQPLAFSADGAALTAIGTGNHIVYTWDLRAIRAQLKELDLDWDAPDYAPAPAVSNRPLRVQVDAGK